MAWPARTSRLSAAATLFAVSLAACSNSASGERAASVSPTTTTTEAPTTTTTAAPTTTTTAKPIPAGLGAGAKGPEVLALEERLASMHYDTGKIDGTYDSMTAFAVMAFQKVEGLSRTGRATQDVVDKLAVASMPAPMMPTGGANRVEVDLKRQVLFLYKNGALHRTLPVSTGNNKRYCVDGQCATAVTPGGSFRVTRKINGLRVSRLGSLYNPLYFNGGIAIHGAPSVPGYPASHGCVRIPMAVSKWFHDTVPTGTPVYVLGGRTAPVPFNEQAPPEDGKGTTTTTAPPTTTSSTTTTAPPPTTSTSTTSTTVIP
jgi:peptidoglycan hydrolase-like protein with peptidoglycan-binding domain